MNIDQQSTTDDRRPTSHIAKFQMVTTLQWIHFVFGSTSGFFPGCRIELRYFVCLFIRVHDHYTYCIV